MQAVATATYATQALSNANLATWEAVAATAIWAAMAGEALAAERAAEAAARASAETGKTIRRRYLASANTCLEMWLTHVHEGWVPPDRIEEDEIHPDSQAAYRTAAATLALEEPM